MRIIYRRAGALGHSTVREPVQAPNFYLNENIAVFTLLGAKTSKPKEKGYEAKILLVDH